MKRRDFIKAFGAISASVPIASALANTNGTKEVIETFQLSDINTEIELEVRQFNRGLELDSELKDGTIIVKQNPNYLKPIYILAYDYKQFKSFIKTIISKDLHYSHLQYISRYEQLLGMKRGNKIIGLEDYWLHYNIDDIMRTIYNRRIKILLPQEYFYA